MKNQAVSKAAIGIAALKQLQWCDKIFSE